MISLMGLKGQEKPVTIVISTNAANEETTRGEYIKDARRLNRILARYLPSETYDRLIKEMINLHFRQCFNERELSELEDGQE